MLPTAGAARLRVGGRDRQEGAAGQEKAVGNQTVQMRMKAQEIIAVGLDRYYHPGNGLLLRTNRNLLQWLMEG